MRLYAMVLPVILGYLPTQQQRVGDVEEARFISQAACACFTVALVALTASCPLPCSSKAQQICLFHLILGCALVLSLAVPSMLCWAPYFSCIRPVFHLLPHSFQLRVLQVFPYVFDAIKRLVGLVSFVVGSLFQMLRKPFGLLIGKSNAIGRLVPVCVSRYPPQSSSPAQANFNPQQVVELAAGGRLVAVGVAQSSSPARANFNLQQVVEAVELSVQSSNAIGRSVAVGASPHAQSSSPAQANFNSQQEVVELRVQEMASKDASTSGVHKP